MSISNVNKLLNYMEAVLERAKALPLTRFVFVDKEELLELIDRTRDVLPKEIQEANTVLKRRDEIHREAQNTAEQILSEAKKEAARRIEENEILKDVKIQAAKIKEDTNNEREEVRKKTVSECLDLKKRVIADAISIREGADKYAESVIRKLVNDMSEVQSIIVSGQTQLSKLKENSEEQIAYYKSIAENNDVLLSRE
ncbi:MAG: hypothetical protein K6A44_03060 [bacterium]|nr:hypothetical protein [bacterium]